MTLHVQQYLRQHGVEKTVEDFKLIHKVKGHLNMFKYNQIESDYAHPEVQDSRGLILDANDNWNVVCLTFRKFFNHQEGFAHPIDWESAQVMQKLDGSIMQMYHYSNEWHVATSGTIDADTTSNDGLITFQNLFWKTVFIHYGLTKNEFTYHFNPDYCYAFELCTPFNLVITQHKDHKLYLLGIRNKITLQEESIFQPGFDWLAKPIVHKLSSIDEMNATMPGKDWQDEGYVVVDKYFNRQKLKNPAYVAVHHLKGNLGAHHVMQVVKDNELEEFSIYCPERKDEVAQLKIEYDNLTAKLQTLYDVVLKGGNYPTVKDFALDNQKFVERKFQGLMYQLQKGKTTVKQWMYECDNKDLYMWFTQPKVTTLNQIS